MTAERRVSSVGVGTQPVREGRTSSAWFAEHLDAAQEIIDFLAGDGVSLRGLDVADVGCGDGIIDLGLVLKASPAHLVGFDVVLTETQTLLHLARRERVVDELPDVLEFRRCDHRCLPADAESFDVVVSWSTFEHIEAPSAVAADIHRVLRPGGVLMIQLWPFFHTQHGAHLWQYFPQGFAHLLRSRAELIQAVRANPGPDPEWAEHLIDEFRSCNGLSLDGLQSVLNETGFTIRKAELLTEPFHVPEELQQVPLTLLGVSGVKLLATS